MPFIISVLHLKIVEPALFNYLQLFFIVER